jgi:hypothetical protein
MRLLDISTVAVKDGSAEVNRVFIKRRYANIRS